MGGKLDGNGIFEGSRFIMPEHKDAMLRQEEEMWKRRMPELAEDRKEEIERALVHSYNTRYPITITMFTTFCDVTITGVVLSILTRRREVKFAYNGDYDWIGIDCILNVQSDHLD